jgi:phosphatidylglycerol:prolipoprotein diacylglycerol transferase
MHPFLLNTEILGMKIVFPTGSLFTILAAGTGGLVYFLLLAQRKSWGTHFTFLAVTAVGALAGGKIIQFIIDLLIFKDTNVFLVILSAGSTITGSIMGAVIAILLYRLVDRIKRIGLDSYDALSIAFAAGAALMRVGCLWTGCCFGKICQDFPITLTYPPDWIIPGYYGIEITPGPRLPFPLIASAALLLMGAILFIIKRKTRLPGLTGAVFFMLYGIYRFIIEFIRDEPFRLFWGPFSFAQWFALCCLAAGIILCLILLGKKPQNSSPQTKEA